MSNFLKIAFLDSPNFPASVQQERWKEKIQLVPCNNLYQLQEASASCNAIIAYVDINSREGLDLIFKIKDTKQYQYLPLIVFGTTINKATKLLAIKHKIDDLMYDSVHIEQLHLRIEFLFESKKRQASLDKVQQLDTLKYKTKWDKRLFDIVFSSIGILLLSPIFIGVALLIRVSSRGPIFYASKRVGAGYKTFDFYKFRSMVLDADTRIKDIKHLNQYKSTTKEDESAFFSSMCSECIEKETPCQAILFKDGDTVCERLHKIIQKDITGAAFIKVKGDPRITSIGRFIRNTSIDELPQLFNVLLGDMSIVGNRPLPLYEAEKITTDHFITRFLAPAGITGLWQISKRGKDTMSQEERIEIDNIYAQNHSLWGDIKIIAKTLPAMLQKEGV